METAPDPIEPLARLRARRPACVCAGLSLSDASRDALAGDPAPSAFLTALLVAGQPLDALNYLAHALPGPRAVRWAGDCVRALRGDRPLSPQASGALVAAERWAARPSDEGALAAGDAADAPSMKDDGAARFVAYAAAWNGASLAPAGLPDVAPPPGLGARAVVAALMIAVADSAPPETVQERYRECLARGILAAR